jgi:alkylation response protein AidB-like acyl-CoA dehydrogenase
MLGSTTRTQQTFQAPPARARSAGTAARERDPVIRQRLADLALRVETMKLEAYRQLTNALRGRPAGISASVSKLVTTELNHDIARTALEILGSYGLLAKKDPRVRDAASASTSCTRSAHHRRRDVADPEEHHRRARARMPKEPRHA